MQCLSYNKYVIVTASGTGERMNSRLPKQFMLLNGMPVIFRTVERIHSFDNNYKIIVVLNPNHLSLWEELKAKYDFDIPVQIVFGGKERFYSVKNAVFSIEDDEALVAVHDGVRPLVTKEVFQKSFSECMTYNNAVCGVYSSDSVRYVEQSSNRFLDRNKVMLIQTPQVFYLSVLKKAYSLPYSETFTDDASVVEALGYDIHLTLGRKENIKLTYPEDLLFAQAFLKQER